MSFVVATIESPMHVGRSERSAELQLALGRAADSDDVIDARSGRVRLLRSDSATELRTR